MRKFSSRKTPSRAALALALALLRGGESATAQVLYGTLTGTVTDPTQAVVPDAKVQVVNVGTGLTKEGATNQDGIYLFTDLPAGVYKINISARSFAPVAREGVTIETTGSLLNGQKRF